VNTTVLSTRREGAPESSSDLRDQGRVVFPKQELWARLVRLRPESPESVHS
jgi:hypothetical protein